MISEQNDMAVGFLLGIVATFGVSVLIFAACIAGTVRRRPKAVTRISVIPAEETDSVALRVAMSRLGMRPDGRLIHTNHHQEG